MTRRALSTTLIAITAAACAGDIERFERPTAAPTRIVAGSVFAAETLLAIAERERIAAVHKFVGDHMFSLVADEAAGLPTVGAEPEDLLSVRPDLVIVDAFTKPETLAIMASAGVPVLRTATPRDFSDIAANIRSVGIACHLEDRAEALVEAMVVRLGELGRRRIDVAGRKVMSLDGGMHTLGRGSLFDAVIGAAGAFNLAAQKGAGPFRIMTFESVLAWRPEILLIDVQSGSEEKERKWIAQASGFHLLPAVANDRIVFVPTALFGTTSHHVVDTVEFIQNALIAWGPK